MSVSTAYLCSAPPHPPPPSAITAAAATAAAPPSHGAQSYGVMSYMSSPPTPGHHHPGTVAHAAHAAAQAHAAAAAQQMAQMAAASSGQYGMGPPTPGTGAGGQNQLFNVGALLNQKDSRWLQLEVCREFQRNKCSRTDSECKFAHPPENVEVQNGKVTACYDSIKVRPKRKHATTCSTVRTTKNVHSSRD